MPENMTTEEILVQYSPSREKFSKLDADRTSVLDRARECSKLTIPSVVTDSGHTESDDLDTPYQAVGSRLVHNLASKLLLTLLPPNTSFFRLLPDPEVVQLAQQQQQGGKDQLEKSLVTLEQEIMKQIEREALRVPIFEAIESFFLEMSPLILSVVFKMRESGFDDRSIDSLRLWIGFDGHQCKLVEGTLHWMMRY